MLSRACDCFAELVSKSNRQFGDVNDYAVGSAVNSFSEFERVQFV